MSGPEWGHEQALVDQAFERVTGLPDHPQTPEHFFMEEVEIKGDDGETKTELYPIPRLLENISLGNHTSFVHAIGGEEYRQLDYTDDYRLQENGALISISAEVDDDTVLGARSEVEAYARVSGSHVGKRAKFGIKASVENSMIGDQAVIEPNARVEGSTVGQESVAGAGSKIFNTFIGRNGAISPLVSLIDSEAADRIKIGTQTKIEDSLIGDAVHIGGNGHLMHANVRPYARIGNEAWIIKALLKSGVLIGNKVTIARPKRKYKRTVLKRGVQVEDSTYIKGGRKFRKGVRVIPYGQRSGRNGSGSRLPRFVRFAKYGNKPKPRSS